MDKIHLTKLLRQKIYWERERDKCFIIFFNLLFYFLILFYFRFSDKNFGIRTIAKIEWSNADGWDKFTFVVDVFLLIFFLIISIISVYYVSRIIKCSEKLVTINEKILNELTNSGIENLSKII